MKLLNVMQALFLTVIISLPVFVVAEPLETPIEKLISELAEKPEHHQAIAAYYHQKAEAAKKELAEHRAMRPSYKAFSKDKALTMSMTAHCDRLISASEAIVKEYESLAKEHEEAVKKQ